jgi:surfactin synthase thioesterase subunit
MRFREPAIRDAPSFARAVLPAVAALADRPIVIFGHSVGALVAFELVREMRREGLPPPARLLISGRQAPHLASQAGLISDLPDAALLDVIRNLGGTPAVVLDDPELVGMFLPALRADLEMNECYQYVKDDALDTPITAFAAASDERVLPAGVDAWAMHTARRFTLVPVEGGHFAITTQPRLVIDHIVDL